MRMIDDVVRLFSNRFTDLVEELDGGDVTPTSFRTLIEGLKKALNEVGRRAFLEAVVRHEQTRILWSAVANDTGSR